MKILKIVAQTKLTRQQIWNLKRLWRQVPHVACKGLCQDQCKNAPVYPVEALYILERHADAQLLPMMHGEHADLMPTLGAGGRCGFLNQEGRCSIYEDRPVICRLFGHRTAEAVLNRALDCQHGCKPSRPLEPERAMQILFSTLDILLPAGTKPPREATAWFSALAHQIVDHLAVEVEQDGETAIGQFVGSYGEPGESPGETRSPTSQTS